MLVVIPTHEGDIDRAVSVAKLIKTLGGAAGHTVRVIASESAVGTKLNELRETLEQSFRKVDVSVVAPYELKDPNAASPEVWTPAANSMFKLAVAELENLGNSTPWIYLEPDSTPVHSGWIDKLEDAYQAGTAKGRRVLGAVIPLRQYSYILEPSSNPADMGQKRVLAKIWEDKRDTYSPNPLVFPPKLSSLTTLFRAARFAPWEMTCSVELAPHVEGTGLIVHAHDSTNFRLEGTTVTFDRKKGDTTECKSIDITEVSIVHGNRDNTLIDIIVSIQPKSEKKAFVGQTEEEVARSPREAALAARAKRGNTI